MGAAAKPDERSLRRKLLSWYLKHKRDLPWRRTSDPYAIWVSEIMLQQTRVDTVIPYYEKFLARFPTIEALARAEQADVLERWSGLGYYRRARLLHKGAQQVCEHHAGELPRDPNARRAISGIGAYTAGAIGSIAYGQAEPLVDGNVKRVLSRIFALHAPVNEARGEKQIWAHAASLVQGPRPGDFNQALMELGALVCTPQKPACNACPVRKDCLALKQNATERLPVKLAKKAAREEHWLAVAAVHLGSRQIALVQHSGERFGGLWMLPMLAQPNGADPTREAVSPRAVLNAFGLRAQPKDTSFALRHQLTHRDMRLDVRVAVAASIVKTRHDVRLVSLDRKPRLPTSSLTLKLLAQTRDVLA